MALKSTQQACIIEIMKKGQCSAEWNQEIALVPQGGKFVPAPMPMLDKKTF
jgi:hypothetical protein